jgi:hypothetical protein
MDKTSGSPQLQQGVHSYFSRDWKESSARFGEADGPLFVLDKTTLCIGMRRSPQQAILRTPALIF